MSLSLLPGEGILAAVLLPGSSKKHCPLCTRETPCVQICLDLGGRLALSFLLQPHPQKRKQHLSWAIYFTGTAPKNPSSATTASRSKPWGQVPLSGIPDAVPFLWGFPRLPSGYMPLDSLRLLSMWDFVMNGCQRHDLTASPCNILSLTHPCST